MDFTQYIKPELVVLVPVLWLIGSALKNSTRVWDEDIPLWLGGISVVLSLLWVLSMADWGAINIFNVIFTAVVQGVLCAGSAVGVHQAVKQKTGGGEK